MKNLILFSLFLFCQTYSFAQITISNNYFPNAGDSLVTANATAQTVKGIRISNASPTAQNWDYSFLRARTATARSVERYRTLNPAIDTAILHEFPTATTAIADSVGQIAVYRRTITRFELLGFYNANLGILTVGLSPKFNPASLERRAPLLFNSTNNNQTGFSIPFSTAIIPDTIFSSLPIRPDSFRIRFVTNRQDKVDAWGTIRIPGSGDINCLRERRYEITETRIDAKSNSLPLWIDITSLLPTGRFKTRDTTLVFHFWSDLYKEPLLTINASNDSTPILAEYKWLPINTPTSEIVSTISANVYPTPAQDAVFVQFNGLNEENYLLNIVDNAGRTIFTQKLNGSTITQPLHIETNRWTTGVYFLNLFSEKEKTILTRKTFVIMGKN